MNFWKWIGSDDRVEQALQQSVSYDIAPREDDVIIAEITAQPNVLSWDRISGAPANNNQKPANGHTDYTEDKMWATVRR